MANAWNLAVLFQQQEASFGIDPAATGSTMKHVKALPDMTFQPSIEVIERMGLVGDLVTQDHVMGPQGGKLAFKLELKASGTPAASAVAAIASEASDLMEAAWGTVLRGTGALTTAGSTTTSIALASGGAGFAKGMAVEILGEVRIVTNVVANTLTLHKALALGAPGTGVVVNASSRFTRANSGHKSVTFTAKRDTGLEYTFTGCKVKAKIDGIDAKGTAVLVFEVDVGAYSRTTKASLPASELSGVTAVKAPVIKGSPLDWNGTSLMAAGLEFDPGFTLAFVETVGDLQNKAGIQATAADPRGSIKAYYLAQNMLDVEGAAPLALAMSSGTKANGWALWVPRAQLLSPQFQNRNGVVGEDLPFACRDNGTDPEWAISVF
jgi:hypothetical protein